jgi:hypothetical protein
MKTRNLKSKNKLFFFKYTAFQKFYAFDIIWIKYTNKYTKIKTIFHLY